MWQTSIHVSNSSKKHVNENMTLPQDFQRGGGLENKQFEIIKLGYPIMLIRRKNVDLDMCHHITNYHVIILLETSDKRKNDKSPTS
jgi:hypothetical protein